MRSMKRRMVYILIGYALVLSACSSSNEDSNSSRMKAKLTRDIHPGQDLFKKNCSLCHGIDTPESIRIAPLTSDLVNTYKSTYPDKSGFTSAMIAFIQQPRKEHALLSEAITTYGLMPKQHFPSDALKEIVDYLFDGDLSALSSSVSEKSPTDIGLEYALETKKVLGKNLMSAIQKEGVLHALNFCTIQAMPLTDSMSIIYNATIRRVSDKPRNPKNRANEKESELIREFQKQIKNGDDPQPILEERSNSYQFYYPIVTNDMCLKCHGQPEHSVAQKIKELYPSDEAIGYNENQVRGIWSIVFNN